jgi:transposase-like protein/IS1 family transposase
LFIVLYLLYPRICRLIRQLRERWKDHRPLQWRPKSPEDCPHCCNGVTLSVVKHKDVIPYSQVKSPRGRKKSVPTQGYACPNPDCQYCGIIDTAVHALVGYGTQCGSQRFKCQACGKVFTSRVNTPLYYLKTEPEEVEFVLLFLAEGVDASVLVRYTGRTERTVSRWLQRMGQHSVSWHDMLFRHLVIGFVQMDELYSRIRETASAVWVWLAIAPESRIIPAMHIGNRTALDAYTLVHDLKIRLASHCVPVVTTDGLRAYFHSITAHFGYGSRPKRARKDHWFVSPDLLYGQLVKRKARKRFAITRMLSGTRPDLRNLLRQRGFSGRIQTAYIERVNLTFRQGISALSRRTWAYAHSVDSLRLHAEWFRLYYHMVRPHQSLSVPLQGKQRRYKKRTPAMAAGITRHIWQIRDLLHYPVPQVP